MFVKLDLDCVRDVLLYVEANQRFDSSQILKRISLNELANGLPCYDLDAVLYTCQKLGEGGYLVYYDSYASDSLYDAGVAEITFAGHEFLETIRPEDVYKRTKSIVSKTGSFALDFVKVVASKVLAEVINAKFGIN